MVRPLANDENSILVLKQVSNRQ